MRLLLCIDMPMRGKNQRRTVADFRHRLDNAGFIQLQGSLFMKTVGYREQVERYISRIESMLPVKCKARILTLTERQYESIRTIPDEKSTQESIVDAKRQLVF